MHRYRLLRAARSCFCLVSFCLASAIAFASGPRYVTGPPFFTAPAGQPIGWRQTSLIYFTDPGDLSASLIHTDADALVAAAASAWNVPVAGITLSQGGSLAEHVSGQNTYLGANGVVFPSDVMASNSSSVPIAIIYDADGSVTDTLLGTGASQLSSCRQNAVTESVDGFDPAGYITHAFIILNGLCTGGDPSAHLQMQYQLERIFGRVLGLAWSQTNDNVFTGTPTPTYNQALNWPIMHPIDILCGPLAYQCLPNPFQLRPDDISGLVNLYPVPANNMLTSKQPSLTNALGAEGHITFPTGEGMQGVNVLIRRAAVNQPPDGWFENSAVTGATFRRSARSPFVPADTTIPGSMGSTDASLAGFYSVAYIPIETVGDTPWQNLVFSTEPVNPLYSGTYSLGPYTLGTVNPSGSAPQPVGTFVDPPGGEQSQDFAIRDAASTCGDGQDGTAFAPVEVAATGWWAGLLCGYGHASYGAVNVHPNRSFTIEVTALDEQGVATEAKAMPVVGLFAPTDAPGALPSLGVTPVAFQSLTFATTSIHARTEQLTSFWFGIADERGDGRPDFSYQGRLFYADTVSPSTIAPSGATLTLSGFGFRAGNAITINGVTATVISSTANTIVLTAPNLFSAHATDGTPVDITVTDLGTGASTTMFSALTYQAGPALPNSMRVISGPVGSGYVGDAMPTPFKVQVVADDGVTPVSGDPITFSVVSGSVGFGACSASNAPCTVFTDSTGTAWTNVTPLQSGAVILRAADATLSQSVDFDAITPAGSVVVFAAPSGNVAVGVMAQPYFFVRVLDAQGNLVPGASVTFSVPTGSAIFSGCFTSTCTVIADSSGNASVFVTPTSAGPVTLEAASGDRHQQVSFTAVANTDTMQIRALPRTTAFVNESAGQFQVQLLHTDGSPDPFESLSFKVSTGSTIDQCGTASCSLTTDGSGLVTISLTPHQVGAVTVEANYGSLMQSASFTVIEHTLQLNVLSAPSGSFPVGATVTTPFTTQLLQDGVTPIAGVQMVLAVPPDAAVLTACNGSSCVLTTDGNGKVSTLVTPLTAGTITLSAAYPGISTTASFFSVGQPETLRVINQPAPSGENVGDIEMFTVQLVGPDGSTPLQWHYITYTVTGGPFAFISCRYAVCTGVTDGTGVVNIWGMVTGAGVVSVQATSNGLSQTMTFTSSAAPDVMHLVSAPSSGSYALSSSAIPFTVQLFFGDGVSFAANKAVNLSVVSGSATFAACGGASSCTVQTDATGTISGSVTPLAADLITVSAVEAGVTTPASQRATFSALPAPNQFLLISVPGSGSLVGVPTGTAFAVELLEAGVAAANRSVSLSISSGSASFAACAGAPTCIVQTDASGHVSTQVTPLAAGSITLAVSEIGATPALSQSATFTATVPSDVLRLTGAPSSGGLPGVTSSAPFVIQLFQPDGVTAIANRSVLISVVNGSASLAACGGASGCTVLTDASGRVSTLVTPTASGTINLVATELGANPVVSQSATFSVSPLPDVIRLLSAPASGGYPGSPESMPFSVQVLLGSGAFASNKNIMLSVLSGSASFAACSGAPSCIVQADASGTVTTLVTPITSGSVTLLASETDNPSLSQRVSFTVAASSDVAHLISAPGTNSLAGAPANTPFAVQLLLADGVTPLQNRTMTISVSGGSAALTVCAGASTCAMQTDAFGVISTLVTPLTPGAITLLVVESGVSLPASQSATFVAVAPPNILRLVSAPASGVYSGMAAGTPFALQVVLPDGSMSVPNQDVTIAVTSGSASFTACSGASSCTLQTDSRGNVSTAVIPLTAGTITLNGSISLVSPAIMQTVIFTAKQPQDVLAATSTPGTSVYVGDAGTSPLTLRLTLADGITPVAGAPITLSSNGSGTVSFAACNGSSCTLNTGMDGTISTGVQGTAAGDVMLTAIAAPSTGAQVAMLAFAVLPNHFALTGTPEQTWIAEGATVSLTLNAAATLNGNWASAETLQWDGTAGLILATASTVTGVTGTSSMWASAGPLAAGASSTATVCARINICQNFTVTGVSSRDLAVDIVSGGEQTVQGGGSLLPLTIVVTDPSGHPVASAPVTVSQTVTALNQPCPTRGRCPAAPLLNSQVGTVVSSPDGTVTIAPLSVSGLATQTELAISSGTQGFVTAVVSSSP